MMKMDSQRIWLHPPKFWTQTGNMSKEQVDELMARVWSMAEEGDLQGLRQFDFISIGNSVLQRRRAS